MTDPLKPIPPQGNPRLNWLERGFLLTVLLGCAAAMSPNQADPDLWGHVTYGLDALADGLPATTTYSYTAEGYPWVNHENLAEIIFAVGAVTTGPIGLLALKCLLGMSIIGMIVWWGRRHGVGLLTLCVVMVVVSINLAYRWAVRPQIFTDVYFTLMILLLAYAFEGWSGRWHLPWGRKLARDRLPEQDLEYSSGQLYCLWLAPLIFFLWANTHGGFVAGLCIFTAILALRSLEALCVRGRRGWGLVRRMALMTTVAWLATFINPYGPGLHHWLLKSLGTPRPEISEWSALHLGAEQFIPFAILAALVVASLAGSRRRLDFTHLVVLALTAWQGISHERHIPFFAILFGFWLPQHLESLLVRLKISKAEDSLDGQMSPRMRWVVAVGLLFGLTVASARLYQRVSDLPVYRNKFPVSAVQYIADQNLRGKLVVTFNWAQYAIAALGPTSPESRDGLLVQFDGRFRTCYPQDVVDTHFDFVLGDGPPGTRWRSDESGPVDGTRVLEHLQPDVVLIDRKQLHSVEVMQAQKADWVLLYQDSLAQVWGRRITFDRPDSPHYIPPARRKVTDEPQLGSVIWPALPVRREAELVQTDRLRLRPQDID